MREKTGEFWSSHLTPAAQIWRGAEEQRHSELGCRKEGSVAAVWDRRAALIYTSSAWCLLTKALNQAARSPSRPRAYSDTAGRRRFKEQMEISAGLPNLPE